MNDFEKLRISGADFIPNHFTAALYWNSLSQIASYPNDNKYTTPVGFAVRTIKIDVPQIRNNVFDLEGTFHSIKKLSSSKDIERKTNFTIRLDKELRFLKALGTLSGENNLDDYKIIANSFMTNSAALNDRHLMLVIALNNLEPKTLLDDIKNYDKAWRLLVFNNVKIIGTSNLEYSVSSGAPTELTVEFIYSNMQIFNSNNYYTLKEIQDYE